MDAKPNESSPKHEPRSDRNYDKTDYYCRECGKKNLLVERGEGDYYVGPTYFCTSCGALFTMG